MIIALLTGGILGLAPLYAMAANPMTQVIERMPANVGDMVNSIWNYELVALSDKNEALTISTILTGIILFFVGLRVARLISSVLRRKLFNRFNMEHGASVALEKITYYIMIAIITIVVLDIANVPLTVFTFIGGALALGVGLGSQKIVNDFISGVILMIEQPIRVGDFIELEGQSGTVINIGARCTQICTYQNSDIMVPNSYLLENHVMNWTLSHGGRIRTLTYFTLSQSASIATIESGIEDMMAEVQGVLLTPPPRVFLVALTDGLLHYEAYFWVDILGEIERREVLGNINKAICTYLHSHGMLVAYPVSTWVDDAKKKDS